MRSMPLKLLVFFVSLAGFGFASAHAATRGACPPRLIFVPPISMFAITHNMIAESSAQHGFPLDGRRFYRGRNCLAAGIAEWNDRPQLPVDPPYWDDMLGSSVRVGTSAAKASFKPAAWVWGLMAAIAAVYYLLPASKPVFEWLISIQNSMGVIFPSVGMGLSVGLMVEVVKVLLSESKRWTQRNTGDALFNFVVFGVMGFTSYYRYAFQDDVFGSGNSWQELVTKVCFDQFIWTVLLANPYQAVLYLWKNMGFSWRSVGARMTPFRSFWGTQMLPVLIANWAFWIPMAFLIYSFPLELQLPLSILAVTIWVMLLTVLTSATNRSDS